ncbi:MAG: triose-phosphate isomerase [Proteobacteria bacterium]|nr:triose-phosphate isomerase [Pseudomonadota bacterium]
MRKKLVVGNWKMNGSRARNDVLLSALKEEGMQDAAVEVVVCPPYPYLGQVGQALEGSWVALGAQNLSSFSAGAYTGEVGASMLLDLGCAWVIVGHSERRSLFGEDDEAVAIKAQVALEAGLNPIVCVGETLQQREEGRAEEVVGKQIDGVVSILGLDCAAKLTVAYEPVWAIGTGRVASPEQAQAMHRFIRSRLELAGVAAAGVRILYGGSVTAENAPSLFVQPDIDGALVGGASLVAPGFLGICRAASSVAA